MRKLNTWNWMSFFGAWKGSAKTTFSTTHSFSWSILTDRLTKSLSQTLLCYEPSLWGEPNYSIRRAQYGLNIILSLFVSSISQWKHQIDMKIVDDFLTSREGDLLKKRKKKTKNKKISLNIFLLWFIPLKRLHLYWCQAL